MVDSLTRVRPDLVRPAVWGSWFLLSAIALGFAVRNAGQVPYGDDYNDLDVYAGERPVTIAWLWEQDYEWREPLPKIVLYALGEVFGGDRRVPVVVNALLLSGAALMLLRAAARLRGGVRLTDAAIPALLLHLGHTRPLLHNHYLIYTLVVVLLIGMMIFMATPAARRSTAAALGAGACLLGLPLCGAAGVVASPPLALWMALAGARRLRESAIPRDRAAGLVCVGASLLTGALLASYALGYRTPPEIPPASPGQAAIASLKFLAMGAGVPGRGLWPASGILVAALATVTWWVGIRSPRPAARDLSWVLLAVLGLAAGVGLGRGALRAGYPFMDHYVTGAVTAPLGLLLTWYALGAGRTASGLAWGLLLGAVLALPANTRAGLGMADGLREAKRAFLADLSRGLEPRELAGRHWASMTCREARMARMLEVMRRRAYGPYRNR